MTNAAEKAVGNPADKDKDKVEKRRALGRGLASLLPGPRVVAPKQVAAEAPITIQAVVEEMPASSAAVSSLPGAAPTPSSAPPASPFSTQITTDASGEEVITISAQADTRVPGNLVMNIELDAIEKNPYQTRYEFDDEALEELANSIRATGVVQPVLVRPAEEEGRYVLILGERRCRATKLAGKTTVPAMVKRVSKQQAAEMTIIENLQREDLNCIEQAEA